MNKLFIATVAASILLFAGSDAGAQPARARASDTAIRREANLGSAVIATLKEGDLVHVVDLQGDWYRVIVPNEPANPRTGFVPAPLIEIISVQEPLQSLIPPQFLMGPAIRVAPPVAQGPMIPPTLAYIMQHRAEAAEHERALQALALERDNALEHERELKAEVDALKADPNAVQTDRPIRQIPVRKNPKSVAPHPPAREGFWFNAGLGLGSYRAHGGTCEDCDGNLSGLSGDLSLGGTFSDTLLLGGGSSGYYRSLEGGETLRVGIMDARLRFYPVRASGFFLNGGVGIGSITTGVVGFSSASRTEHGIAGVLGLGWDIRVRPNVSLTPFWNGIGVSTSSATASFGQLGLGITVH
jgi:hypothetical protein